LQKAKIFKWYPDLPNLPDSGHWILIRAIRKIRIQKAISYLVPANSDCVKVNFKENRAMNQLQTFEQFLANQSVQVSVLGFVVNLALSAVLAYLLSLVYAKYGHSLSNRKMFARNFIMITMTTMLIITIVKASLALSLGLVGALSIVRFRAAIKEPEELAYLFLAIGIGLGFGADQRIITTIAFAIIMAVIWLRSRSRASQENHSLYLTLTSRNPSKVELDRIVETLQKHCNAASIKRFDENKDVLEASFLVEVDNYEKLNQGKAELRKLNDAMTISFMQNNGVAS
jgi:uncharacterized membrane protein YhiD involved in acid resistance